MIVEIDPIVEQYFAEIEDCVGMSSAAEGEIGLRIKSGEEEAVRELVQANLRFVVKVAKQYTGMGLPLADLIGEGNLGMIIAARRFDAGRGFRFISYAVWWIRHTILKALADQSRVVRLPGNRVVGLSRMIKASRDLEQELGRAPDNGELAVALDMTPDAVEQLAGFNEQVLSLDSSWNDGGSRAPGESIPDTTMPAVDECCYRREMLEELGKSLAQLTAAEAEVLTLYFGLGGLEPMTLEQIGTRLGRTRERVRQIKVKALLRLRRSARGRRLHAYLETD